MIAILTSGAALGVHIPGLLLADRLRERNITAEVQVIERLLPRDRLGTPAETKWVYHRSFRFAVAGRRMERDTGLDLDETSVRELWTQWQDQGVRNFVVLSGYWLSMLRGFREFLGELIRADLCRGDTAPTQSSLLGGDPPPEGAREINLSDAELSSGPCTNAQTHRPRATRCLVRPHAEEPRGTANSRDVAHAEGGEGHRRSPGAGAPRKMPASRSECSPGPAYRG